jgi:putative glycosyltransferase
MPSLSVVIPAYNEEPNVAAALERVSKVLQTLDLEYEIILVNDGSPDDSLEVALQLHRADPRISIIDLSRNFGQHKALMTGLAHARGRLVFVLDVDLEESPELLELFYREMMQSGADVVYGVQSARKGTWVERLTGDLFYRLFNLAAAETIPRNTTCARLMSQRYVAGLLRHHEREVFLQGLWMITGFKQVPLIVPKRSKGTTSYSFAAKVAIVVNAITSFSNRPLVAIFYLGWAISLVAAAAAADLIVRRLFFGRLLSGWPSLIVSIWLLGGLTICSLGIIGIYLSKVFNEVKQRPYTIVRDRYVSDPEHATRLHGTAQPGSAILYEEN